MNRAICFTVRIRPCIRYSYVGLSVAVTIKALLTWKSLTERGAKSYGLKKSLSDLVQMNDTAGTRNVCFFVFNWARVTNDFFLPPGWKNITRENKREAQKISHPYNFLLVDHTTAHLRRYQYGLGLFYGSCRWYSQFTILYLPRLEICFLPTTKLEGNRVK